MTIVVKAAGSGGPNCLVSTFTQLSYMTGGRVSVTYLIENRTCHALDPLITKFYDRGGSTGSLSKVDCLVNEYDSCVEVDEVRTGYKMVIWPGSQGSEGYPNDSG